MKAYNREEKNKKRYILEKSVDKINKKDITG